MFGSSRQLQSHSSAGDVTVRLAQASDAPRLARLAALDSASPPAGPTLVAEVDRALVAALPIKGGSAIADPFHRTAALLQMLELRATQLRPSVAPASAAGTRRRMPFRAVRAAQ